MKIIHNYIRNVDDILNEVKQNHLDKFKKREGKDTIEGFIPNFYSRFSTLYDEDMSNNLKDLIFKESEFPEDVKNFYKFIQIQKYNIGDYIVPHSDNYSIQKLYLITLTDSLIDGLMVVIDGELKRYIDSAGTYLGFPYDAPHWVEPVRNERYSLVVGF